MKNATNLDDVAIFWDYENCPVPSNSSGFSIAKNIWSITRPFGSIKVFKAYFETSEHPSTLRSDLQSSGVTLVDCPHNGRKEVADKMLLVDIMAYALDNPVGSTIVLITGDRDFAYALSTLTLRQYQVVLIAGPNARPSLIMQADIRYDWVEDVIKVLPGSTSSQKKPRRSSTLQFPGERYSCPCIAAMDSVELGPVTTEESAVDSVLQLRNRTIRQSHVVPPTRQVDRQVEQQETLPIITNSNATAALPQLSPMRRRVLSSVSATDDDPTREINAPRPPPTTSQLPPFGCHPEKTTGNSDATCSHLLGGDRRATAQSTQRSSSVIDSYKDVRREVQSAVKPLEPSIAKITDTELGPNTGHSATAPLLTQPLSTGPLGSNALRSSNIDFIRHSFPTHTSGPVETQCEGKADVRASTLPPPTPNNYKLPPVKEQMTGGVPTASRSNSSTAVEVVSPQPVKPPPYTHLHGQDEGPAGNKGACTSAPTHAPLVAPPIFGILVKTLQAHLLNGIPRPLRSTVALQIANGNTYRKAGVNKFGDYMNLALNAGIIELGGREATAWVGLKPQWFDAVVPRC